MNAVLRYELEKLEHVITNELLTTREQGVSVTPDQLETSKNILRDEVERIKKKFVHEIYAFEDERHLERHIQLHQQELIRLMDLLAKVIDDRSEDQNYYELHRLSCAAVEDLLTFIERHFTKYFDQDTKAPESYITLAGSDIVKTYGELQDKLNRLATEPQLIELVLHPMKKFIENIPAGQITYRKIIYVKEIQKEIQRIVNFKKDNESSIDDDLRAELLYLNYNTIKYFRYYTNYVVAQLETVDSSSGRIERLSFFLKMVNQTQMKPGVGYNRTIHSLKEQLAEWLAEEIFYLEKMHKLNEKNAAGIVLAEDFKLKTEMSVSQLAYLLRVFIETKVINNKNVSDLIRFFSRFFQTKRLESISYESFRVRYYNTEDGTKRSVRNMLLLMVDYINKN
ncbi:MAG TPA: hypothetical protein PLJ60_21185 [Chryseolinea sp.]|nr:hypothetical protein [Chryseolinea sp.]